MKIIRGIIIFLAIVIICLPIAFLGIIIIFEDKRPEHEKDWMKEDVIYIGENTLEDVQAYTQTYLSANSYLVNIGYSVAINGEFFYSTYCFYCPAENGFPNGLLTIFVDELAHEIRAQNMNYSEDVYVHQKLENSVAADLRGLALEEIEVHLTNMDAFVDNRVKVSIKKDRVEIIVNPDGHGEEVVRLTYDILQDEGTGEISLLRREEML